VDIDCRFTRIEEKLARQERQLQLLDEALRDQERRLERLEARPEKREDPADRAALPAEGEEA